MPIPSRYFISVGAEDINVFHYHNFTQNLPRFIHLQPDHFQISEGRMQTQLCFVQNLMLYITGQLGSIILQFCLPEKEKQIHHQIYFLKDS